MDLGSTSSDIILRAARLAAEAHKGQTRKYNGDPYIFHPGRVAARASIYPMMNSVDVAIAWLHDVIEDCPKYPYEYIEEYMGKAVADGCQIMTNPSKKSKANRAERKKIDREHWKNAPPREKILKLMDRCDNLREFIADAEAVKDPNFLILYAEESQALLYESLLNQDVELEKEFKTLAIQLELKGRSLKKSHLATNVANHEVRKDAGTDGSP